MHIFRRHASVSLLHARSHMEDVSPFHEHRHDRLPPAAKRQCTLDMVQCKAMHRSRCGRGLPPNVRRAIDKRVVESAHATAVSNQEPFAFLQGASAPPSTVASPEEGDPTQPQSQASQDDMDVRTERPTLVQAGEGTPRVVTGAVFRLGRHAESDLVLSSVFVSRRHCSLHEEGPGWVLRAQAPTHVQSLFDGAWETLRAGEERLLRDGQHFALVRSGDDAPKCNTSFTFILPPTQYCSASHSFDTQYLRLLYAARHSPIEHATKGAYHTVPVSEAASLVINLQPNELPLTSLRYVQADRALVECLWYLLGTDKIEFLQRHDCKVFLVI